MFDNELIPGVRYILYFGDAFADTYTRNISISIHAFGSSSTRFEAQLLARDNVYKVYVKNIKNAYMCIGSFRAYLPSCMVLHCCRMLNYLIDENNIDIEKEDARYIEVIASPHPCMHVFFNLFAPVLPGFDHGIWGYKAT